jgi:molybdopterin synthase sulfur carrier subunit
VAGNVDFVSHELADRVESDVMTAKVRIPTVLRPAMGGLTTLSVEGSTIGEVLNHLTSAYPAIKGQLVNEDGTLHRFLNVYVNDDDVRYLGGVDAPVANDDEITLLPAVAGGAR